MDQAPPTSAHLLDLVSTCDLIGNVDPVQFAIRLLVPPGSLLLDSGALDGHLDGYDTEHLSWTWHAADRRLDALAVELAAVAVSGADRRLVTARGPTTPSGAVVADRLGTERPVGSAPPHRRACAPPSHPTTAPGSPSRGSAAPSRPTPNSDHARPDVPRRWEANHHGNDDVSKRRDTGRIHGQRALRRCRLEAGAARRRHEWVSFPDPDDERTWLFDVTFLESNWTCIFGHGCQGVLTGPAPELVQGCCSYGAHFTGPKDARRVEAAAATLTPEQWQFWSKAEPRKGGKLERRQAQPQRATSPPGWCSDACIFLNRPEFPGGPGCALHRAAIERGVPHLELKPDVCWQLPLRREDEVADDGHVTSVVRQWDRRDWGRGRGRVPLVVHRVTRDAFVGARPSTRNCGTSSSP